MDKLRDFMQSWPGKAVLLLTLVPMAFMGVSNFGGGAGIAPNEVVKVGSASVGLDTYRGEVNAYRSRLLETVDVNLIDEKALADEILQGMIDRALLENQSQFLGMTVSDEMITRLLRADSSFHDANGQFSNDLFAQYLQSRGMTKSHLFDEFRVQLSLRQLTSSLLGTAIYPDSQIGRLLDLQLQSREVWLYRLAWQNFVDKVNVGDDEIETYYQSNKDKLIKPATVDLAYLELSDKDVKIETPSDEEIQAQYQSYLQSSGVVNSFGLAQILLTGDDAESRAKEVKAKLDAGGDFKVLAKEYSDDPTGQSGGDIGSYNPAMFGESAKAVESALDGLGVGQSSDVVKTQFGYHIFNITRLADVPSLDSMRDELIKQATEHKRKATFEEMVAKINGMATDGMGVADIAQAMGLTAKNIKAYPQTGNQTELSAPSVIATAFDEFAIADQSVSANITLADKTVWVQSTNHEAERPMTKEEASADIKAVLAKQKAIAFALNEAQDIAKQGEADPKVLATKEASIGQVGLASSMLSPAEKASLFLHQGEGLSVWTVETDEGASVLVGSPITSSSQPQLGQAERMATAKIIRDNVGQDQLGDYLQYLRDTQEIQLNEQALKQ